MQNEKQPRADSFSSAVSAFLAHLTARGLRPATIRCRQVDLKQFSAFLKQNGVERVQDITLTTLRDFRSQLCDRHLSQSTIGQYLRAARLLLGFLEERGVIFESPARRMAPQRKTRPLPRVPSEEQIRALLAAPEVSTDLGIRDRALLELLYCTGVRVGEAVASDVSDADLTRATLRVVGKGGHERTLPLGASCLYWLGTYLRTVRPELTARGPATPALWLARRGARRLTRVAMESTLRRYSIQAGILPPIAPHAVRRATATHMLVNGASPLAIQQLLGHASLTHLGQYLRLRITDLKEMHARSRPGQ